MTFLVYIPQLGIQMSQRKGLSWSGEEPHIDFLRKLNSVMQHRLKPYTTVHNITLLCCQNREIFSIYSATRSTSVHQNDQHVQGWNPTTVSSQKIEHNGA